MASSALGTTNSKLNLLESDSSTGKRRFDKCSWICFRSRLKLLFCPIRRWHCIQNENGEVETIFEIFPDAFRMCFYLYFFFFALLGFIVTANNGRTDFTNNPVTNNFGANNICVLFDDPPFSWFGSTLWWPATILMLSFEVWDYIRVRDHYLENYNDDPHSHSITKYFVIYYSISTLMEIFAVICFAQVFATSPTDNLKVHTWPYICLLFTFWLLVLKRYLYLRRVDAVPSSLSRYGIMYVLICGISMMIKLTLYIPNLYGAELWVTYPWTKVLNQINDPFYLLLNGGGPMLIYGFIGMELDTVVMTLRKKKAKGGKKQEIEMGAKQEMEEIDC